ncbi:MAG: hypothetical protein WCX69_00485 [Candidatus Paceibacterota bacterium]
MIQIDDVKEKIREAVREFKALDHAALSRVDIYEPTISHRIAVYLGNLFRGLNVDCQYSLKNKIRPDIIIHKRSSQENYVIFEIKKSSKNSLAAGLDIKKLEDAVGGGLGYDLGVFIGVLKRRIDICWIEKTANNLVKNCETI